MTQKEITALLVQGLAAQADAGESKLYIENDGRDADTMVVDGHINLTELAEFIMAEIPEPAPAPMGEPKINIQSPDPDAARAAAFLVDAVKGLVDKANGREFELTWVGEILHAKFPAEPRVEINHRPAEIRIDHAPCDWCGLRAMVQEDVMAKPFCANPECPGNHQEGERSDTTVYRFTCDCDNTMKVEPHQTSVKCGRCGKNNILEN